MRLITFIIIGIIAFLPSAYARPPTPPTPSGTAAELTTGTNTASKAWSAAVLAGEFSGGNTGLTLTADSTHGGYTWQIYSATSGTLTGTTDTISLSIPSGALIIACQLHVKTAVVDDGGDDTWDAELNDGAQEEVIGTAFAAAQNTNVNHRCDEEIYGTETDSTTDILLTPNGGSFTAGEIEATCKVEEFVDWSNE